jgi:DNA polymerase-3 subunit delta'
MSVGSGSAPRYFVRDSLPRTIQLQALLEWSRALLQAARHAEHPFNAGLMAESLVGQGQRALTAGLGGDTRAAKQSVHSRA